MPWQTTSKQKPSINSSPARREQIPGWPLQQEVALHLASRIAGLILPQIWAVSQCWSWQQNRKHPPHLVTCFNYIRINPGRTPDSIATRQ